MNNVSEGKINDKFVGLKSKTYSMKNIDDKEYNSANGVNIATEFNELKDILFNKKVVRHKMKRIQSKKHKIETQEIKKYSYCVLMAQNLFVKKINRFKIVLIVLYTILLTCTPINSPIKNLFVRTYFHLRSSVRISSFYENLSKSFFIC